MFYVDGSRIGSFDATGQDLIVAGAGGGGGEDDQQLNEGMRITRPSILGAEGIAKGVVSTHLLSAFLKSFPALICLIVPRLDILMGFQH